MAGHPADEFHRTVTFEILIKMGGPEGATKKVQRDQGCKDIIAKKIRGIIQRRHAGLTIVQAQLIPVNECHRRAESSCRKKQPADVIGTFINFTSMESQGAQCPSGQ